MERSSVDQQAYRRKLFSLLKPETRSTMLGLAQRLACKPQPSQDRPLQGVGYQQQSTSIILGSNLNDNLRHDPPLELATFNDSFRRPLLEQTCVFDLVLDQY